MNQKQISSALTQGLLAGYGGKTDFQNIKRGPFDLKSSYFEETGIVYHDEWTNGGGQELVSVDGQKYTRVYAGGVADKNVLASLEIGEKDVIKNLVSRVQELKENTRLFSNCSAENVNGWGYSYTVLDTDKSIGVTTGKEMITFNDTVVFVHVFVISSISL